MANHAATALHCDENQRSQLEHLESRGGTPQKIALRARIVLRAADGRANLAIAKELGISRPTVLLWRERFARAGVPGIMADAPRPGRKKAISPEKVRVVVEATLHSRPPGQTHWSVREMAQAQGVSRMTVQRIWKQHNLQPHRLETFKLSKDKNFVTKLRDVVGLYLSPPDKALVLSVDEKSQIQALDRTQPSLPIYPGRCGTMTHDYKRNGTTTLFAAIELMEGRLIGTCMPRHRHQEWIKFLNLIDEQTPAKMDLHLIVDNYNTHKHPKVQRWLKRHPRFHIHFIPTSSSWLNLIERWFREITDKRIRRGVFKSVDSLIQAIMDYIAEHNENPKSFTWIAKAEDILAKVRRARAVLDKIALE